jgi:hypothetical protein
MLLSFQQRWFSKANAMTSKSSGKRLAGVAALAVMAGVGCGAHLQQTSGSPSHGSPPLCFQYRGEARPSPTPGQSNIWVMANNTCSYPMDCMVHDDATDQQNRIVLPPYGTNSYLLAIGSASSRVNLTLDCTWTR